MISAVDHARFRKLCDAAHDFVLTTHIHPDGDALGSQLSLAGFLVSRGKRVRIVNNDPTTDVLRFLERDDLPVEVYDPATHDDLLRSCDRLVLVDNSAPDRLGRLEAPMLAQASKTLCIDHHPSRHAPWAEQILDEDACATTVMIYELVRACGWSPDPQSADALYVGLATDTGYFRFNSTNPHGHEVAADLLRLGVSPARAYQEIYERNSLPLTRLLGRALAGVRTYEGGAVASVRVTRAMADEVQAGDVDTSEITTSLLVMDGIRVALLFRELEGGRVKVSLRSKGNVDVHRLASEFGGGGHRNASGIVMPGAIDDVIREVTDRAIAAVQED
jgi:phosphoesterase RecJ-like protein